MNLPEDDPPSWVDTREFFLPGSGVSALLIHGLSGTPYEMRYLGESLAAAGMRVQGVKLAGHVAPPEELGATTHLNWYESVVEGLERLRTYDEPKVVIGLSAGAVLAARLALDQPEEVAGVVMLAPAFYLQLWKRTALRVMSHARGLADQIYFRGPGESDIHDAAARRIHPGTRLMPLSAAMSLIELSDHVRARLPELTQPALVIHGRQDHTCPFQKNVDFVMSRLGSADKRAVALEESFHVVTVDSERERVSQETIEFASQFRQSPTLIPASGGSSMAAHGANPI
jgi:carboxylesterase